MKTLTDQQFFFDEFEVDVTRRVLLKQGKSIALNPKAFDLLVALIERRGEIISKNDLLDAVWQNQFVEEKNLTVHVAALRKAFGERKDENRFIATIPGTGYKFVAALNTPSEKEFVIETEKIERITIEETEEIEGERGRRGEGEKIFGLSWYRFLLFSSFLLLFFILAGWYWGRGWRQPVEKPEISNTVNSIAVLPFQVLNSQTQNDGLELGLTESLINRLSSLRNISIRPVSAVRKYTGENRDLAKISDELKVDSVLEGYIQREENRLRLTIRLLNTRNGLTIWNEQIDENFADIFAVQDKISNRVVGSLQIVLSDKEKSQLAKVYTENVQAYKKYLIARHQWDKRTPDGFAQSVKLYKEAIDLDPTFALAYAGLADSYLLIGLYGIEPPADAFPKARAAAEKSLEIDRDSAEAEVDLAMVENLFQYDWKKAEEHFSHAIELKPNYSTGQHWFGLFLAMQGRTEEALNHLSQAKELDPLSPSISTDVAFAYYLGNQNDSAIEQLNKTLKLEPDFPNAHNNLGMNYLVGKRFDEALAEFEKADQLSRGNFGAVELIWANGFIGNKEKARQLLAEMPKNKTLSPFEMAIIHTSFGEKEKAIGYLREAYEKRDPQIVPIKVFPPFESLRQEPEFTRLLKEMNLL